MKPAESKIEIRRARPADASSISSVLREAFIEYRPLYTEGGFAATTPSDAQIINRMKEGPVWVALLDNTIVGTSAAIRKADSLHIRGMAAHPSARGVGIGRLLLRTIEEFALSNGCHRLSLSTTPFLTPAIRLYEGFGFRRTSEGPHDLLGTPLFTMVKTLDRPDLPL
jgi:putative acetyltransferase